MKVWRRIAGILVGLALIISSGTGYAIAAEDGLLEIRITDHQPGIEDFAQLDVVLAEVLLHKKGKPRNEGWVRVLEPTAAVDIVPLKNGKYVKLGQQLIASGRFDAARIAFDSVSGRLRSGGMADLAADGSTVRTKLVVEPGSRQSLLIDLFVEDQTEHEGGTYVVKVRRIEIENMPAANGGDS